MTVPHHWPLDSAFRFGKEQALCTSATWRAITVEASVQGSPRMEVQLPEDWIGLSWDPWRHSLQLGRAGLDKHIAIRECGAVPRITYAAMLPCNFRRLATWYFLSHIISSMELCCSIRFSLIVVFKEQTSCPKNHKPGERYRSQQLGLR